MKPVFSLVLAAALLLAASGSVIAQNTGTPAVAPIPAAGGAAQGRGGGGRGPSPQAMLFTDNCAGCHGVGLEAARAPSLFTQAFLNSRSNAQIEASIRSGVPGTEMGGFGAQFTDVQIAQLADYLRIQGAALKPPAAFMPDPQGQVIRSRKQNFRIDVVARGLSTPWGEAFLPDGRLLVTERDGRLRVISRAGVLSPEPISGTPAVHVQQDGGMLDVAVSPGYATNGGWIYLAYVERHPTWIPPEPAPGAVPPAGGRAGAQPPSMSVIVRGKINAQNAWIDNEVIYRAPYDLYTSAGSHYGMRLLFDRRGHLFFTLGERGAMANAQDVTKPLGKIHRINEDGTIPSDNPLVNTPGAVRSIWSTGHRNPQGLAFNPADGLLWEAEHGPTNGDEINIIDRGANYGWGVATSGSQGGITQRSAPGMVDPITYYTPTLAPSGIGFYSGTRYPNWRNSLFVAGLAGQKLLRLEVSGRTITSQEVVFEQFGRVRQVITGPDGLLYVLLQNPTGAGTGLALSAPSPGMVVKLTPAP